MAELKIGVRLDAIPIDATRLTGLQKALAFAAELGANSVEICGRTIIRPADLSDTGLRQLRKMLDDLNLRVAAIRFSTRRGYDQPADLQRRIDATKDAMKLAYRLGAPAVINQVGRILPRDDDGQWPDAMQSLRGVLDDLGRFGAKVGAFFCAETGTESGVRLADLLDQNSDQAYITVAFNPGQLIINRHDVRESLLALRDRVAIVSAMDGVLDLAAGRGISIPIGQGTADFPELLGILEDSRFDGPLIVGRTGLPPAQSIAELRDGVAYLRGL